MSEEAADISISFATEHDTSVARDGDHSRRNERLNEYMRDKQMEKLDREAEARNKALEARKQQRLTGSSALRNAISQGRQGDKSTTRALKDASSNENMKPPTLRQSVAFSLSTSLGDPEIATTHSKAVKQLESRCEEMQQALQSKQAELQTAHEEHATLTEQLQASEARASELKAYSDDLEVELNINRGLLNDMQKLQDTLKADKEAAISEAHRQQTILQREILEVQGKLRDSRQELALMTDTLQTSEAKLQAGLHREKELARNLDRTTAQHERDREAFAAEKSDLQLDLTHSQAQREKLSQQLSQRNQELEQLRDDNAKLTTAIESHKANEFHLRREVMRLEESETRLIADKEAAEQTATALEARLTELKVESANEQARLQAILDTMQAQAAQTQERLDIQAGEVQQLQEENSALTASSGALKKEIEVSKQEHEAAMETHKSEQASLQAQVCELSGALAQRIAQAKATEAELTATCEVVQARDSTIVQLNEKNASLTSQLRTCEGELQTTRERLQIHEIGEKDSDAQKMEFLRQTTALKEEVEKCRQNEQVMTVRQAELQQELSATRSQFAVDKENMQSSIATAESESAELRRQLEAMAVKLASAESAVDRLSARELELLEKRRFLNNRVLQLQGNIRVFVRVRPTKTGSPRAAIEPASYRFPPSLRPDDKGEIEVSEPQAKNSGIGNGQPREKKFKFAYDKVFAPDASQECIYNELSPLVQSVVDGYPVCLLAYGQTSSGKTYTMIGQHEAVLTSGAQLESKDSSDESVAFDDSDGDSTISASENKGGVIVRAAATLFELLDESARLGWTGSVSISVMEVYNDTIRDLTVRSRDDSSVTIRHNTDGSIEVVGARALPVRCADDIVRTVRIAMTKRCKKSTRMNADSSRSHCVFQINVHMTNSETGAERNGTLHVVDLAGSERVKISGSLEDPDLLKEAKCINKSLSALGNVFNAMYRKERHIPFRDSTITHLLQPCLGPECKVLLICNIAPEAASLSESLSTLRFARKVNETTPSGSN